MGILSALSGKIYHFNSINTPIDNDISGRISKLDNSIEKISLAACFDISQRMVLGMFDPDNGMFSSKVKSLSEKKLRTIWFILMLACVELTISSAGNEISYGQNMVVQLANLFDQSQERINDLISEGKMQKIDSLFFTEIWYQICSVLEEDPENKINSTAFITAFSDIYDTHTQIAREQFKIWLNK